MAAAAQTTAVQPVPGNIAVPAGNTAFVKGHAVGTQNYVCLPGANGLAWKFQGPQATVFVSLPWITGEIRHQVMTHYLSPNPAESGTARATWQSSLDTSAVWAVKVEESNDPAFVAPGAIPWFLLRVTGSQAGPVGSTLSPATFIQRINTSGGVTPTDGCATAGAIRFVPYEADYVFYKAVVQR
jgi:hypothetical protein